LMATEVVQGPGADNFARPTLLDLGVEVGGSSEDGYADAGAERSEPAPSPRLVDPAPAPTEEKPQTSPEEAAMLAKLVGLYVGFGWGLLAAKHEDKLGPLAEQVAAMVVRAKPELAGVLGAMSSRDKFQAGLGMLVGVVEDAAAKICVERNIRIPWQNELIVAGGIGTATVGIVQEFMPSGEKRDEEPAPVPAPPPAPPPPPPRAAPSWSSRGPAQSAAAANADDLERPAAILREAESWT
jgi:hypothetical protein